MYQKVTITQHDYRGTELVEWGAEGAVSLINVIFQEFSAVTNLLSIHHNINTLYFRKIIS